MKGNNMGSKNMIMVDFAAKDSRSVSAMLRGRGDGRDQAYKTFLDEELLKEPILTEAELADIYGRQCRAEYHRLQPAMKHGESWIRGSLLRLIAS